MQDSTSRRQLVAALAAARALVASLEAAVDQTERPVDDPAVSLEAAARATQLSPHTLRSWCRSGRLRSHRGPRGAYLVRRSDIDAAIEAAPSEPAPRRRAASVVDLDAWEVQAERELAALGGAR